MQASTLFLSTLIVNAGGLKQFGIHMKLFNG